MSNSTETITRTVRPDGYTDGLDWCKCYYGNNGAFYWAVGGKDTALQEFGKYQSERSLWDDRLPINFKGLGYITLIEIGKRQWKAATNRWIQTVTDTVTEYSFYVNGETETTEGLAVSSATTSNVAYQGPYPEDLQGGVYPAVDLLVIPCDGKTFTPIPGATVPPFHAYGDDTAYVQNASPLSTYNDATQGGRTSLVYPPGWYVFAFKTPSGTASMLADQPGGIVAVTVITDESVPDYQHSPQSQTPYPNLSEIVSYGYAVNGPGDIPARGPGLAYRPQTAPPNSLWYDTAGDVVYSFTAGSWQVYTGGYPASGQTQTLYNIYRETPVNPSIVYANNGIGRFYVSRSGFNAASGDAAFSPRGESFALVPPWIQEAAGYDLMIVLRLTEPGETAQYYPFAESPNVTGGYIATSVGWPAISGTHTVRVRTQYTDPIDGQVYAPDWLITGPVSGTGGGGLSADEIQEPGSIQNLRASDSSFASTERTVNYDGLPLILPEDETVWTHGAFIQWDAPTPNADRYRVFIAEDRPGGIRRRYERIIPGLGIPAYYRYVETQENGYLTNILQPNVTGLSFAVNAPGGTTLHIYVRGENGPAGTGSKPGEASSISFTIPNHGPEAPGGNVQSKSPFTFMGEENLP